MSAAPTGVTGGPWNPYPRPVRPQQELRGGKVVWRFLALAMLFGPVLGCGSTSPAALRVLSAKEELVVPRHAAIQGRDGGPSALAFGRTIWTYGDTVLEQPDARGEQWHTNSWQHADPATWKTAFVDPVDGAGAPAYVIARTAEEVAWDDAHAATACAEPPCSSRWALWPGPPLVNPATGAAWVFYLLLNDHHPSGVGVGLWRGLEQPVERQRIGESWLLFAHPDPEFGSAPLVREGHLYSFACEPDGLERLCSLARVPLDAVADRSAWRFFDGHAWVADLAARQALFKGAPIMSLAWNAALARFLLVYARPFDHQAFARTAEHLEGPWSDEVVLFEVPGDSVYDLNQHAELEEEGGRTIWLTFSRKTNRGWFGAEHAAWRVEVAPGTE